MNNVPLSHYDLFVAPEISTLVGLDKIHVSEFFDALDDFCLNGLNRHVQHAANGNVFIDGGPRQHAMGLIHRSIAFVSAYKRAREFTYGFVVWSRGGKPDVSAYFDAIMQWESCLLNLQVFVDIFRHMTYEEKAVKLWPKGSTDVASRAYEIANCVKHWGNHVWHPIDEFTGTEAIPLWMTRTGLGSLKHSISFEELCGLVVEFARIAQLFIDPKFYLEHDDAFKLLDEPWLDFTKYRQ
jgi:hypothetical protein